MSYIMFYNYLQKCYQILILTLLYTTQTVVQSSHILGIFHERSFSHQILGTKLLLELASRGHHVTMLTPVVPKFDAANFTAIEMDLGEQGTGSAANLFEFSKNSIWDIIVNVDEVGLLWTETVLKDKNLQRLLRSSQHFDLVIMEQLGNHALKGICYHYKAICMVLSTMGPTWLTNEQMRNPNNPSFMPDMLVNYPPTMNFYERFHNAYAQYLQQAYFFTYTINQHNKLLQTYFPGAPHIHEILYNVSLVLVNSHYSTSNPASNLPNVIEIGGFHLDQPKPLPLHLETFLNEAEHGAIYFSMGSILQIQDMETAKFEGIIKNLGQLPQRVLWKVDNMTLPELPSNIMVVNWAPQLDVLAHPNIRLFITHGGLLSMTEAVSCGVPILGISVFADQGYNSAFAEASGFGIAVPYEILNEENFGQALDRLLNSSTYMKNAQQRANLFRDQPMKPLDRAMFWIEYVIRHKGAPHLRSTALNLTWYQYLLFDVLFVVFLSIAGVGFIFMKIYTFLYRKVIGTQSRVKQKIE